MAIRMKHKKLLLVILVLSVAGLLAFWYQHTRTTLRGEEIGDLRIVEAYDQLCNGDPQLYPLTIHDPFPAYSADGRFYVDVQRLWPWERSRRVIEMYAADNGRRVGRYVSSERSLFVFCWAEDSTGIYVADYIPGSGSIFIGLSTPSTIRPIHKLLVLEPG